MLTGRSFGKLKHFAPLRLWTERFRPTCAAWADVPLQVADVEGRDPRLCVFMGSAPRWEGGWQGAEVLLVRTNGWDRQKEQESKRGKGSEGSPGYMGSRVCVWVCVCATCFRIEYMWLKQLHFIYSSLPSSHLQTHWCHSTLNKRGPNKTSIRNMSWENE